MCCLLIGLCLSLTANGQKTITRYNQTFRIDTLFPATGSVGMNSPWEVLYGPDDSLWVTESRNYKIWKIHPGNKGSRQVLDLSGLRDDFSGVSWPQGGLMGLAIHPDFYSGKPWVYIAYVYHLIGCGATVCPTCPSGACSFNTKIVRYRYNFSDGSLTWMNDVISGLHGSNDHNSGRIRISPLTESDGNYHLYYTIGDMGAGNLTNANRTNHAQDTTILEGKILRLNTEPDLSLPLAQQWIPGDNPYPAGAAPAAKNPIYSYGHRNPQGLVFGSVNGGSSYILYSSEHGDKSDDEVNIINPHTNYGWPKVAGLCDDNYTSTNGDSMYLANKSVISETGFCNTNATQEPIYTFFNWDRDPNKAAGALANSHWPTIAPASIAFYGQGNIPGWNYSLLIPSLKDGLYRLKLKSDGLSIDSGAAATDTFRYLLGYRLRNVTVAPTGDTLFVAVDNSCCTLGPNSILGSSIASPNLGFILRMVYITPLPVEAPPGKRPAPETPSDCKVFPNPASKLLNIQTPAGTKKPLLAQLYDRTGQIVLEKGSTEDLFTMDIHGLASGLYVLRLFNGYAMPLLTEKILVR